MWDLGMEVQKVHRNPTCHSQNQDYSHPPCSTDLPSDFDKASQGNYYHETDYTCLKK